MPPMFGLLLASAVIREINDPVTYEKARVKRQREMVKKEAEKAKLGQWNGGSGKGQTPSASKGGAAPAKSKPGSSTVNETAGTKTTRATPIATKQAACKADKKEKKAAAVAAYMAKKAAEAGLQTVIVQSSDVGALEDSHFSPNTTAALKESLRE
eukprot:GDKJ01024077.1.p1 GENE.GDKJ01024077.1~~GDKJ01024077.1.p1  ORF type:complete len:155 (-),score=17.43 GDKJ01024077.1:72-536(-)